MIEIKNQKYENQICKIYGQRAYAHRHIHNWYLMRENCLNKYGYCIWNDFLLKACLCIHPGVQLIYSHQENRSFPAAHIYLYNPHDNEGVKSSSLCPVSLTQKHMDSSAVVPFHTTNQAHRSFWRKSPAARDLRDMFTSHNIHIHTNRGSSSTRRESANTK